MDIKTFVTDYIPEISNKYRIPDIITVCQSAIDYINVSIIMRVYKLHYNN